MKQNLFIFLFTTLSLTIFSQEKLIYVEYDHGQEISNFSNKEILIAGKDKARYDVQELTSISKEKKGYIDEKSGNVHLLSFSYIKPTTLYKTNNESMVYFDKYINDDEKQWFIVDNLPVQEWELISGETKTIEGYKCNKAKLKFRGSEFTAYYTSAIPTTFGPWKFSGLPGLILEISLDGNSNFYWKATKVVYPYKEKVDFGFEKEIYRTPYQRFIKEEDKAREKRAKASIAKSGGIGSFSFRRIGLEKVYEWEDEKTN